jgi:hypothetical protein
MVDTGRHPRMGFEPREPASKVFEVKEFVDRMAKGVKEAKAALAKAKDKYAMYYNHHQTPTPKLKPGNHVWLDASDIKTTCPSAKLGHHNLGLYLIERCIECDLYRL